MTSNLRRRLRGAVPIAAVGVVACGPAVAHVKWFCGPVDVTAPPLSPAAVLSGGFLSSAAGFLLLVMVGSTVDALLARRWPRPVKRSPPRAMLEEVLIRFAVAAYLVSLVNDMAMAPWGGGGGGTILTPELLERDRLLAPLQLATALMLVFRRTAPLAAAGMLVLYAIGVVRYGMFHMVDYVYFLGLAAYLALSAPYFDLQPTLHRWRLPLLTGGLGFSLMWTAIEKFLYPSWTAIVIAIHPDLTFGFPVGFATMMAGFVEFSLSFYLIAGCSLLRLDALALAFIFLAAMPEFGGLDLYGHLPILAILLVVMIHGPTRLRRSLVVQTAGPGRAGAAVGALYMASLAVMMVLYYAVQRTAGWF